MCKFCQKYCGTDRPGDEFELFSCIITLAIEFVIIAFGVVILLLG